MSDKPTAAKPAAGKSAEKSKEAESKQTKLKKAKSKQPVLKKAESKELGSQKKEQTPSKEPTECTKKTAEKVAEAHEMETSSTKMIFMSKTSTSDKPVDPKDEKIPQTPKTTSEETVKSEKSTPSKSEAPETSKRLQELCQKYKISSETSSSAKHQILEVQHPEECQMSKISDKSEKVPKTKEMSTSIKLEAPEVSKVTEECQTLKTTSATSEMSTSIKPKAPEVPKVPEERRISTPVTMDSSVNVGGKIQSIQKTKSRTVIQDYRDRFGMWPPLSAPNFEKPYIVLATYHMVPALPMELFDVLAEMIEAATNRPVVLIHEKRRNRPIAKEVFDIVVMSATETWTNGDLLPASFVFDHPLNKTNSAEVYVDIVVSKDRSDINSILDLRDRRCAIPDRRCDLTAAGLLFDHLHSKTEIDLLFFKNVFEASSQYCVLEMINNDQADVGVVESPVIRCRKDETFNVKSIGTLGPLPPYRIMVKNPEKVYDKIATYLLNVSKYDELVERLLPYGVTGFSKNSEANYQRK